VGQVSEPLPRKHETPPPKNKKMEFSFKFEGKTQLIDLADFNQQQVKCRNWACSYELQIQRDYQKRRLWEAAGHSEHLLMVGLGGETHQHNSCLDLKFHLSTCRLGDLRQNGDNNHTNPWAHGEVRCLEWCTQPQKRPVERCVQHLPTGEARQGVLGLSHSVTGVDVHLASGSGQCLLTCPLCIRTQK
jgi:hypothetical protein